MTTFYDFSGGMESAAMLVVDRERIRETSAIVRWADTGKQFPEMASSISQIESLLQIEIARIPPRIGFDDFLFNRGGMVRKGTNDCSRRMKRANLAHHAKRFTKSWEINLGFNAEEIERSEAFSDRNERPWCHWRYPLIEARVLRSQTWGICREAGFTILVSMYEKMGRFDCFFCGNQSPKQALKVVEHYPQLANEWMETEERKGHSFMPIALKVLVAERDRQGLLDFGAKTACACFGGTESVWDDEEPEPALNQQQRLLA